MTYYQNWNYYEDGKGTVNFRFVVSDSYTGLFAPVTDATEVNIFELDGLKEDLDGKGKGLFSIDEIEFSMNEAACSTAAESDAVFFVLEAQADNPESPDYDATKRRFCALLLNPSSTPLASEMKFRGIISPEMKWKDMLWDGAEYSSDIAPLREWKVTTHVFDVVQLDTDLKELIAFWKTYEVSSLDYLDWTTATDEEKADHIKNWKSLRGGNDYTNWKASHVADRLAYFKDDWRETRYLNLVNLNALMAKLCAVHALLKPEISIVIETTQTDVSFTPFRWIHDSAFKNSRWLYDSRSRAAYVMYENDAQPLTLSTTTQTGTTAGTTAAFISYEMLEPRAKSEEDYSFLRAKTFSGLIFGIARCFAMYPRFSYADATTLSIRFEPRSTLESGDTFIPDATDADGDTKPFRLSKDETEFSAAGCSFAPEGLAVSTAYGQLTEYYQPSRIKFADNQYLRAYGYSEPKGEQLLLSLSPAVVTFSKADVDSETEDYGHSIGDYGSVALPLNCAFYDSGNRRSTSVYHGHADNTEYLHSAIYVTRLSEHRTVGENTEGTAAGVQIFAPAGLCHANIDGKVETFTKLADYCNAVFTRDEAYYQTEYSVTVPFLCRFRATADGSESYENARLGSKITLDGVEYVTVGIERNFRSVETKLKLQSKSRLAFVQDSTGLSNEAGTDGMTDGTQGRDVTTTRKGFGSIFIPGETLAVGEVAYIAANGKAYKAKAESSQYGMKRGIVTDVYPDGVIAVLFTGRHNNTAWTWTTGGRLFVRNGTPNLSHTHLPGITGSENLFIDFATADSPTSIVISNAQEFIYE